MVLPPLPAPFEAAGALYGDILNRNAERVLLAQSVYVDGPKPSSLTSVSFAHLAPTRVGGFDLSTKEGRLVTFLRLLLCLVGSKVYRTEI